MKALFTKKSKNMKRSALILFVAASLMFCFAFALVPLYDIFCDITGINGKTKDIAAKESQLVDQSRKVTVEFIAYTNPKLGWIFEPEIKRISVFPGETHRTAYLVTNLTQHDSVGQAVPSVTPGLAAKYLNKVECFCFNRQELNAGQKAKLPLVFYVSPDIPKEMHTLTLAYTLFKSKSEPAEKIN